MGIFNKRTAFKPFTYKEVEGYKLAIQNSYWTIHHFNFINDIQDYKTELTPEEQEVVKRCLLAISQIEVSVKRFWVTLGNRFPVAEIDQVGVVFGESEVRHADSYSHLLEILGFNDEFEKLLEVPAIKGRVNYLSKYIKGSTECSNREYVLSLALFSIFIENVSLFSQFLIIQNFKKEKTLLKNINNIIQATAREETVHNLFGVYLINKVNEEHPGWFDEEFYEEIRKACLKSYKHESEIIDWIFENGELDYLPKDKIKEFIKDRFNQSMKMIGAKPVFDIDHDKISDLQWFNEGLIGEINADFFDIRPVSYSRNTQSCTEDDLF